MAPLLKCTVVILLAVVLTVSATKQSRVTFCLIQSEYRAE